MSGIPTRRIGDEERNRVAEILTDHLALGRLDQEEFESRLGAALTAQTSADLGRLVADLPLPDTEQPTDNTADDQPFRRYQRMVWRRVALETVAAGTGIGAAVAGQFWFDAGHLAPYVAGAIGYAIGRVAGPIFSRLSPVKDAPSHPADPKARTRH